MADLGFPPALPGAPFTPTVIEHRLPLAEVQRLCRDIGPAIACMDLSADRRTCTIWLPENPPAWLVEHERMHCQGYLHFSFTTVLFDPAAAHNAGRLVQLIEAYDRAGIDPAVMICPTC